MKIGASERVKAIDASALLTRIGPAAFAEKIKEDLYGGLVKEMVKNESVDIRVTDWGLDKTTEYSAEVHIFSYRDIQEIKHRLEAIDAYLRKYTPPEDQPNVLVEVLRIENIIKG